MLYGLTIIVIKTGTCLLDTGAAVNLIRSLMIPNELKKPINQNEFQSFKQRRKTISVGKAIVSTFFASAICVTKFGSGVASNSAADRRLGTLFIDGFTRSSLPSGKWYHNTLNQLPTLSKGKSHG